MADLQRIVEDIGRAGAHTLLPNDFEYYAVTLELTDSNRKTIEYLTFPVTPDNISYDDHMLVNVKKTFGGISATDSDTSRPKKISFSGGFGRRTRLLTKVNNSGTTSSTDSGQFSSQTGGLNIKSSILSTSLKTGYGTTKVLKSIVDKSSGIDEFDKPLLLFLYLPILGENYLVKVENFRLNQDLSTSNMLWRYSLNLVTLANLDELGWTSQSSKSVVNAAIQRGVGVVTSKIEKFIRAQL